MKIVRSKWLGLAVAEVQDNEGNRFDLDAGLLTLSDGKQVQLSKADHQDINKAVQDILWSESALSGWMGGLLGSALINSNNETPENILGIAGRALIAGEDWRHHLGRSDLTQALDTQMRVDERTGAHCLSTTFGASELSAIEQIRALAAKPTRFMCLTNDGSTSYLVDTVEEPDAAKHLKPASRAESTPSGRII